MKSGESGDSNTIGDFPLSMEICRSANLMKSNFKGANVDGRSHTQLPKSHTWTLDVYHQEKPGGKQKLQQKGMIWCPTGFHSKTRHEMRFSTKVQLHSFPPSLAPDVWNALMACTASSTNMWFNVSFGRRAWQFMPWSIALIGTKHQTPPCLVEMFMTEEYCRTE